MKSMRTSTLNHSKEAGGILAVFCVTLVVFFGVLAILIDLAWINKAAEGPSASTAAVKTQKWLGNAILERTSGDPVFLR